MKNAGVPQLMGLQLLTNCYLTASDHVMTTIALLPDTGSESSSGAVTTRFTLCSCRVYDLGNDTLSIVSLAVPVKM